MTAPTVDSSRPPRTMDAVSEGLRAIAVDAAHDEEQRRKIAEELDIPTASVDKMLRAPQWDLDLAMTVIDALDLHVRVHRD